MILSAIAVMPKQCAEGDFKRPTHEAVLIVQAVPWRLRYPLSYRDLDAAKCFFCTMLRADTSG